MLVESTLWRFLTLDAVIMAAHLFAPGFKKVSGGLACRRTLLVIAHRINTILDSDMLLVLSDGKLVEQGSPSELSCREGGTFARLVQAAQQANAS